MNSVVLKIYGVVGDGKKRKIKTGENILYWTIPFISIILRSSSIAVIKNLTLYTVKAVRKLVLLLPYVAGVIPIRR